MKENYIVLYESNGYPRRSEMHRLCAYTLYAQGFQEAAQAVVNKPYVERVIGVAQLGPGYPVRPYVSAPRVKTDSYVSAEAL